MALILGSQPADYAAFGLGGHRWTTRLVLHLLVMMMGIRVSRSTLARWLHELGMSWQKSRKRLAKADPLERWQFLALFWRLYAESCAGQRTLVYIDECHVHQDVDRGYGWWLKGARYEVASSSPGLAAKLNWYGAYNFTAGQVLLFDVPICNGSATIQFLRQVAGWLNGQPNPTIIWDNSPVHTAKIVREEAAKLGLTLIFLPAYSHDLNPIEGLWRWLREDLTYSHCHASLDDLWSACVDFADRLNRSPDALVARLWPPFRLPEMADADDSLDLAATDPILQAIFTTQFSKPRRKPRRRKPQSVHPTKTATTKRVLV